MNGNSFEFVAIQHHLECWFLWISTNDNHHLTYSFRKSLWNKWINCFFIGVWHQSSVIWYRNKANMYSSATFFFLVLHCHFPSSIVIFANKNFCVIYLSPVIQGSCTSIFQVCRSPSYYCSNEFRFLLCCNLVNHHWHQ